MSRNAGASLQNPFFPITRSPPANASFKHARGHRTVGSKLRVRNSEENTGHPKSLAATPALFTRRYPIIVWLTDIAKTARPRRPRSLGMEMPYQNGTSRSHHLSTDRFCGVEAQRTKTTSRRWQEAFITIKVKAASFTGFAVLES
jgi:hypothetical protein